MKDLFNENYKKSKKEIEEKIRCKALHFVVERVNIIKNRRHLKKCYMEKRRNGRSVETQRQISLNDQLV